MALLFAALLATALTAGLVARFTRVQPIAVALIAGVPGGVLGLLVAAGAASTAAWGFALIAYLTAATAGALGAFAGRLRRAHRERKA